MPSNPEKKAARAAEKARLKADLKAKKKAQKAEKKAAREAGKKVSSVPKGLGTVTPNLVFEDSAEAIEFYQRAFDARERLRMLGPDGKSVWHAELEIGDSVVFINDASPLGYTVAPSASHRATCAMQLYVEDCDAWYERAVQAGARPMMPVSDMFWGDRMGGVVDPFGVSWMIATRKKKLSPKELDEAREAFVRAMAAARPPSAGTGITTTAPDAPEPAADGPASAAPSGSNGDPN